MVDYVKVAALAERLITKNGREVTFFSDNETPTDANKPWKGSNGVPEEATLSAVFVPPNTVRQFGLTALGQGTEFQDLISFSEEIGILFPQEHDIRQFSRIRETDTSEWGIIGLQVLKPGPLQVLAFVGVRR